MVKQGEGEGKEHTEEISERFDDGEIALDVQDLHECAIDSKQVQRIGIIHVLKREGIEAVGGKCRGESGF